MEGYNASGFDTTKVCKSFEERGCVVGHHVTSEENRDGGQGYKFHCIVPLGYSYDRCRRGDNRGGDLGKAGVVVYDQILT